ncbi:MAG: orotate phosphoribosyltransferase [Eubacteriales bacterium]|nr:orotate phosphoribosyltransferase [Eubacteriales bacterium]
MQAQPNILSQLFETQAFRVSPADQAFWYTSGKFGPFYVNTHFLFGSEAEAKQLLSSIDYSLNYPLGLARMIGVACVRQYHTSVGYRMTIDLLAEAAANLDFDLISGGARRDFFFSFALADKLGLEHLAILKDGSVYHSNHGFQSSRELKQGELSGKKVLHVADLVTSASSYFRSWLPALDYVGAEITDTLCVVDRQQGGEELLAKQGVKLHSLLALSPAFFEQAATQGQIDQGQKAQLMRFFANPDQYMKSFLEEHPGFLEAEAQKDERTAERVARFRELAWDLT